MTNLQHHNLNIKDILNYQQNRYPLLFIDKILNVVPGESAVGLKNFTYNEWYFPAHFEGDPNVPGFIQIEALVQTFIMTFLSLEKYHGMKTSFVSANNIKIKRKLLPGDTLYIKSTLKSFKRGIATGYSESFVEDSPACRADFIISIPEILDQYKPKPSVF